MQPSFIDPSSPAPRFPISKAATVTAAIVAHSLSGASSALANPVAANSEARYDQPTQLDRVVVEETAARPLSSPKFTAPLVDTPQTIAVIPSAVFTQQSAATLSDVLRHSPGITFAAGEGGNVAAGDSFYLRGFDASSSLFIDGVRDTGNYARDVYNVEQVEIAKGPAGADSGRGGSSGYVNLATKTPRADAFADASVVYGFASEGEDQRRATLDLNQPLTTSTASSNAGLSLRLNALWQDSGIPGRDHVQNKSRALAPSLALGLGTPTRLLVAGSRLEQENVPDSGLPVVALPGTDTGAVDQSNFYGLAREDFDRVTADRLLGRVEHDFNPALQVSEQVAYARTDRDALTTYPPNSSATYFNPTTRVLTPRRLRNQSENEILSSHTNVIARISTGFVQHRASTGLELSREQQFTPMWTPVSAPPTDLHAPDPHRPVGGEHHPVRATNNPFAQAQIDTAAFYVFDTLQLHERMLLNASLRWERFETDYTSVAAPTASVPIPPQLNLRTKDDLLSWKVGLIYKPAPNGSLYAAYANSSTPPGSGFTLSDTATNQNHPNLAPQEARNFEVGAKWEFFNKNLSTSLAFYRSENDNVVSTDALTGLVTQDISQTVEGVEFGLSGKLTADWLVYGGFGYIDATYHAAGTSAAVNDGAGLRFTPKLSGNLWTTYALARRLTIGGGVHYSESVVRSTSHTLTATTTSITGVPSYWLFNALVAYAVNQHLTLRLNVNNVFDEDYYRLNNNGGRYYPGIPRTFLLTADLKF